MEFHSPEAFLLLILTPLLLEKEWRAKILPSALLSRSSSTSFAFSSATPLAELPQTLRMRLRSPLLSLLKCLTFFFLVFALARPQTGTYFSETQTSGRDIMLALDISASMKGMDFHIDGERVNRLAALKSVVKDFIKQRAGDRLGLVVFGTDVFTQCPLTADQAILEDFVDGLEIGMAGDKTAIGDAIAISLKRIIGFEADSKVILLVTDGRNTAGTLRPADAAALAKDAGVNIHSIGIGGKGRVPFPGKDWFGRQRMDYYSVELDDKTLKEVAEVTGGKYFHAQNTEELQKVYAEIDKLEAREAQSFEYVEYEEHYFVFASLGALLFLVGELLTKSLFLRVP